MMSSRSLAASSLIASILVAACADDETTTTPTTSTAAGGSGAQGGSGGEGATGGEGGGGQAVQFKVTVENVSAMSALPTPLSPGVWAVHGAGAPFFDAGSADRGDGLEGLAEDGDTSVIAATLAGDANVAESGVFDTPVGGAMGPALPGESYEFTVTAAPGEMLSFATMFVQSNDVLVAPDAEGIELFDGSGDPLPLRDVTADVALWDAGTEKEEAPGMGPNQAPAQAAANTGPAESVVSMRVDSTRAIPVPAKIVDVSVTETGGEFAIQITNVSRSSGAMVTALSPLFVATHDSSWSLYSAGTSASAGLELLAESGDPSQLVADEGSASGVGAVLAAGAAPFGPTESVSFAVTPGATNRYLSFASMLVATNDVFVATPESGVELLDSNDMPRPVADVQADIARLLQNWDAGTETNQVPGAGANQPPNGGGADEGGTVALYADRTNDLDGSALASFVDIQIVHDTGTSFILTVDNTSDTNDVFGGLITPIAWAIHDGTAGTFEMGAPAPAGLQLLAEDGDPSTFVTELMAMSHVAVAGAEGSGPAAGGLGYIFSITASQTHRYLNIASMIVPSNDTFISLGAMGVELLDNAGAPRADAAIQADIDAALAAYDAGSEINQAGATGPDMAGPGLQPGGGNTGASEGDGTVRALASPVWGYPAIASTVRVMVEPVSN